MCGFVGIFHRAKCSTPVDLEPLLNIIRHRGPDDTGYYTDPEQQVQLGFVRLSIIDLVSGRQPVRNETGEIVCILNGEIYNYVELRAALLEKGHVFNSQGDAETVVHLYEQYGDDFLSHLEGMFAIALWDNRRKRLVIARDHFGIKPLYYASTPESFAFASEIKPLLKLGRVSRELDDQAIVQFLSYGYVLNPRTIFKDIRKIEPGSFVVMEGQTFSEHIFWDISSPVVQSLRGKELKAGLLDVFDRSIRLHLRSDVPVGAFLSGGIDSAFLVARAAAYHPRLKTYTLSFQGHQFDEAPLAELVAQQYGTDHTAFMVNPDTLLDHIGPMVWFCDEPLADSGLLPNFIINRLAAADGVKVVLNGAGGDELFGGYSYYFATTLEQRLNKYPRLLGGAAAIARKFDKEIGRKLDRALSYESDPFAHYLGHVTVWPEHELRRLLPGMAAADAVRRGHFEQFDGDSLNAKLYADIKTYLTDDLMLLLDRTTMAHSIEGRVPFLNHPLAEFVMGIPADRKTPGEDRKHLLKETARPFIPAELINQPKRGFNSPIAAWMKGDLGRVAEKVLKSDICMSRPWWDRKALASFLSRPEARERYFHRYYTLFMLEVFVRMHCDAQYDTPPAFFSQEL